MHQDTSAWGSQIRDLTTNLSLRNSASNEFLSLSMIPSTSSTPDANFLLDRLHEMEDRQQRMEGLLGGAGGTNAELEEVRAKRVVLEERQWLLEEELKQWKRRLKNETPGSSKDSRNIAKNVVKEKCARCEEWMEERVRIEKLERELNQKQEDVELERVLIESEKSWLEEEKRDLEDNQRRLQEEDIRLQALQIEQQKKVIPNQVCLRCEKLPNISKLEETLCKNLNELAVEKAKVEGEKAWIECVKRELLNSRSDLNQKTKSLEAAKLELENQKKVVDRERQQISLPKNCIAGTSSSSLPISDLENLRQRELLMTKKAQELYELKGKLEEKQQQQATERNEIEQQWEQLTVVQRTLDQQKKDLEREKNELLRLRSLAEWEKELNTEREKLTAEMVKLKRDNESLNRRELEIETNFNLLEIQMKALTEIQPTMGSTNNLNRYRQ